MSGTSGPFGPSIGVASLGQLVDAFQQLIRLEGLTYQQLVKGVAVNPVPRVFTVAGLPTTGANGEWAFAGNGRKPGEGGGAGTGVPVFFNSATGTWFSYCSGAVVTA